MFRGLPRLGALLEDPRRLLVQRVALLDLRIRVLRHEAGPGRRVGIREGMARDPRGEGRLESRAEPADVQRRERVVALLLGLDPRVEGRDIQELLLTAERELFVRLDPDGRGGAVALGLGTVPPRRLIAAPRRGEVY